MTLLDGSPAIVALLLLLAVAAAFLLALIAAFWWRAVAAASSGTGEAAAGISPRKGVKLVASSSDYSSGASEGGLARSNPLSVARASKLPR